MTALFAAMHYTRAEQVSDFWPGHRNYKNVESGDSVYIHQWALIINKVWDEGPYGQTNTSLKLPSQDQ